MENEEGSNGILVKRGSMINKARVPGSASWDFPFNFHAGRSTHPHTSAKRPDSGRQNIRFRACVAPAALDLPTWLTRFL